MPKTRSLIAVVAALTIAACAAILPARPHAVAAETIPVYVFAGQSNMVGYRAKPAELPSSDPSLAAPSARVLFWGPLSDAPERWSPMAPATESAQSPTRAGFGPELSAARALGSSGTVAVVKLAVNGTNLHTQWDPATPGGLYSQLVSRTRSALAALPAATGSSGVIRGFFWMQGESDTDDVLNAQSYAENLAMFVARLRGDLNAPSAPFVQGLIAGAGPFTAIVRDEQAIAAASIPDCLLIATDDLERATGDPIHFSTRGTVGLGARFAASL